MPARIPILVAKYASQLHLHRHDSILQDDTLTVQQSGTITQPARMTLDTKRVSEGGLSQLKPLTSAQHIKGPVNPRLNLLLIPLTAILFLSVQRRSPHPTK